MILYQKNLLTFLLFLFPFLVANCQIRPRYNDPTDESVSLDSSFLIGIDQGLLQSDAIPEASGIAYSRQIPAIWTHNDSGGGNDVFLIGEKGEFLGKLALGNIVACDWEDIAVGVNPKTKKSYLIVAETGDNVQKCQNTDYKILYRFKEPNLKTIQFPFQIKLKDKDIEILKFKYPDGRHDVETVIIDPQTQDMYFFTKREPESIIFRFPYPQKNNQITTLEKVGKLHFTKAIAGGISWDGNEVIIKNYANIYYWKRQKNETLIELFARKPVRLPYKKEPQGEALTWKPDGSGFFTLSERGDDDVPQHLYFYRRQTQ